MKHSRVTIRYAKALLQLAIEQNILEQSYMDMVLLDSVFKENKDLSLLLKSPIVKTDQKLNIFKQIFGSKIGEVSMAFINIITTKKRESLLALIAISFISLYKEHNKIETASVISATPLDEILRAEVNALTNNKINNYLVDLSSLIVESNEYSLVSKMKEIVPEFVSNNSVYEKLDVKKR